MTLSTPNTHDTQGEVRFTGLELHDLFGDDMPIEVAQLIFGPGNEGMTIGQVRAKVREIAVTRNTQREVSAERLAEILANPGYHSGEYLSMASELLSCRTAKQADGPTHRHVKRGSEYVLIGVGKMQAENWVDETQWDGEGDEGTTFKGVDMREVAVYRSVDDGQLWARPAEEFNDGRFEALPSAPKDTSHE